MQPHAILDILVASSAFRGSFSLLYGGRFGAVLRALDAMSEELNRNFSTLKAKADPAPYFLSYEVTEEDSHGVSATLGALTSNGHGKSRRLDVCVRVGSPKLDNYHRVRGERSPIHFRARCSLSKTSRIHQAPHMAGNRSRLPAGGRAADQDPHQRRSEGGRARCFQRFLERGACRAHGGGSPNALCGGQWAARVRKLSEKFSDYPGILTSSVSVTYQDETKYFVSSEGSRSARPRIRARGGERAGQSHGRHGPGHRRDFRGHRSRRPAATMRSWRRCGACGQGFESAADSARSRAVRRPRDFFGPRRRRVLSRDFRPPRRGPPAEGRGGRADLHQERRRPGAAGFSLGGLRSDAQEGRQHRAEWLLFLR